MSRIWIVCLIGGVLTLMLSGCWNRRELNTLAIELGTAIDKEGDQYRVSVQVVDPSEVAASKTSSSGRSPVNLYQATAPTVYQALRKITDTSPRLIYGSHIRVLILSEELAREGIGKVLDLLSRDPEMRTDFYVLIAKNTNADNVLRVLTPMEKIPSMNLFSSLETSSKMWAPTTTFTLDELISQLVTEASNPVLTGVMIKGNSDKGGRKENIEEIDPSVKLTFSGLALFKKDRLVGWLNEPQSKGYNYIMDKMKSTASLLHCPDGGNIVIETVRSHTKVKSRIENGEPVIDIHMKSQANIAEVACELDLKDPSTYFMLQDKLEKKFVEQMKECVHVMQTKFKTDVFGFGHTIYQYQPQYWKKLSSKWDEEFSHVKVNYKSEVRLWNNGSTSDSFIKDIMR
ncbi:spore germination protein KC [Paenibacillus sp. 1_12]|uniref:Ger(x)C family spore germination protein n=1 Tax=Paenibacillus sp. 1_12 TaxID=1566278 RepID=UPI0008EF61CA|nr:Ger(x)C family spore germination protein [Paenibacillus sp. 1_12]SFM08520.1 spore germination protein KC [Paenibacillus sp. 1_12]